MKWFTRSRRVATPIDPDEIFIDASNLPAFSRDRFEGRIEDPIRKRMVLSVGVLAAVAFLVFGVRLAHLQIIDSEKYVAISEQNRLGRVPIFAARGVIYDRNGIELAWNVPLHSAATTTAFTLPLSRQYRQTHGFAHLMGYVTLPRADRSGNYYRTDVSGIAGVESAYNTELKGVNGSRIEETDAMGSVVSGNIIEPPVDGASVYLAIDARLEEALYDSIQSVAQVSGFVGGAGVIMDVESGELLALTSYPEYDPNIMVAATDTAMIASYQDSNRAPFLNRAISGLFVPGSIVKPFVALGALAEGVITASKQIESTGVMRVPNPFYPGRFSTFVDWRAHGFVDMRRALAVSSDIYFYQVGGGFGNQRGIGIANIEKYSRLFGMGSITGIAVSGEADGVIPNPKWKEETFDDQWRVGDTYNTSIGQYGFLVTPLQMARATAALANRGTLLTPSLIKTDTPSGQSIAGIPIEAYQVVHEGMHMAVTEGTAAALLIPGVSVAAKTGTAQVGMENEFVNSWVVGFYPYEKPRYAFALLLERAPAGPPQGAPAAMRQFLERVVRELPEHLGPAVE